MKFMLNRQFCLLILTHTQTFLLLSIIINEYLGSAIYENQAKIKRPNTAHWYEHSLS